MPSKRTPSTGLPIGRGAFLPAMYDPVRREQWGLPARPEAPGDYIVELSVRHPEGLEAAARCFERHLYKRVVRDPKRQPTRLTTTLFRGKLTVPEWEKLIQLDESWATDKRTAKRALVPIPWHRCIYRIWPDFRVRVLMDRAIATIKADAALHSFSADGEGIVWAVVDSGIQANHPHFGPAGNPGRHLLRHEDVLKLHRDFTRPGRDREDAKRGIGSALTDTCGHGTHVAGILAGCAPAGRRGSPAAVYERTFDEPSDMEKPEVRFEPRSVDPAELRGVAPRCRLVSLKAIDADGYGRSSDIIRAMEYIRTEINTNPKWLNVHGVNLSVGYEFDAELFACGQSPLCAEVDRLVQSGVVVVAAAGNTGYGTVQSVERATNIGFSNSINDPGNAVGAITVGATHREFPHTYGISYFSSKGPTGDGRLKPDLVAPGERITSCAAGRMLRQIEGQSHSSRGRRSAGDPRRRATYMDDSGTSMAAAYVSGAIAAFLSIRREFIGKPAEVKRIFVDSATRLGRERYFEGHGLLDLMRAIQSI